MIFNKQYDVIFSIGQACSCSQILRKNNLQTYSYPFDWLFGADLLARVNLLCNNTDDFINKDDLEFSYEERNISCNAYYNKKTGITFNHDFKKDIPFDEMFLKVSQKYKRRFERLKEHINKSQNVLVVWLQTPDDKNMIDDEILIKANEILSKTFKNTQIDFLYLFSKTNEKFSKKQITKVSNNITKINFDYDANNTKASYEVDFSRLNQVFSKIKTTSKFVECKKTEKNLVSVIIPAYNHENYVQKTINSIIEQTYKNIELIVIDDGSKDSTWSKIQDLKPICEKRFKRTVFLTKDNEGTCKTLNKLINIANGEYIYLIASDDISKPTAIEKEVDFLKKNKKYALVVGDNEIIDSADNVCYWDENHNNVYDKAEAKFLTFAQSLASGCIFDFNSDEFGRYENLCIGNFIPNGYLIRKSIFKQTGYFTQDAPLEDYWLMLQISKYAKIKFLNEILFSYRWHDTNTIKSTEKIAAKDKQTREYEQYLRKDIKKLKKNKIMPDVLAFIKYGHLYNIQGIPFVFNVFSYNNKKVKTKIIKIFNLPILKIRKEI